MTQIIHLKDDPGSDYNDRLTGSKLVVSKYEAHPWDGNGDLLSYREGKVEYFDLSHCSCYGPLNDGPRAVYTPEEFLTRNANAQAEWHDEVGKVFRSKLLALRRRERAAEKRKAGT